ncbi:MAG: DinB family protein [Rubripirellula sp.]
MMMSNIGSMIAASADLGLVYAERLLTDVTPDRFARFAVVGGQAIQSNHPAFIYGHLSLYASRVIEQVGGDATEFQPSQAFTDVFSKDAQCVDDPDGTIYPAMDEVVQFCLSGYRAASEALKAADDQCFHAENPNEAMRAKFPTNGAMLGFYVGGHFMMHMGQLSAWRRVAGLGPA